MEIWKYEMFRLVNEYEDKPGLAPPLVILELIWLAGKKICFRQREKENSKRSRMDFEMGGGWICCEFRSQLYHTDTVQTVPTVLPSFSHRCHQCHKFI